MDSCTAYARVFVQLFDEKGNLLYTTETATVDLVNDSITVDFKNTTCDSSDSPKRPARGREFVPEKIIYNRAHTVCFFPDGSKTISNPSEGDDWNKDIGVMACIVKKMFGSRSKFMKLVNSGYVQAE